MEKLKLKYESVSLATNKLNETLSYLDELKNAKAPLPENLNYEKTCLAFRDSLVYRFKFTIELFWKYLKLCLEEKNVAIPTNTPTDVIRTACKSRLISEEDTEVFTQMLKSRNLTSHIYQEEIADQISKDVITFYPIIKQNIEKLKPNN